ncbi:MAG: flagellar biosynthesis protein FlhF [Candidatus Sericytochromatia bacterium]|nr:flagellar biosynthesis protein FlhF [Candidatus Sericytochromatia bacterium]
MKIRQYTAPTIQEAILKIKVDLGPNAVILHSKKLKKGGVLGFFSKDVVEVLAADPGEGKDRPGSQGRQEQPPSRGLTETIRQALPEDEPPQELELGPLAAKAPPRPAARAKQPPPPPEPEEEPFFEPPPAPAPAHRLAERFTDSSEEMARPASPRRTAAAVAEPELEEVRPEPTLQPQVIMVPETGRLAEEVSDLKASVTDLKTMMATLAGKLEMQPRSVAQFPTLMQRVYDKLLALDVDPSIARGLVVYLQKEQPHLKTYEDLCDALETPISGLFGVSGPIATAPDDRKIVALIGPTGVGKTTTIAKLAANFALSRQTEMALLTIDTYRVAAIEQLKTYGDIIGLPVDVVLTPQSLKEALKTHQDKGLILIDTAGRSPYNRLHINELRSFLDVDPRVETHLVLSATTRLADLKQIVKHFASTGVDRLIFSKTDETDILGGVVSIAHETGLPVSYVTTGQSVPDDIMVAEGPALARMLVQQLRG